MNTDKHNWEAYREGRQRPNSPCPIPIELAAYLDGTVSEPEKARLERHFARCAACSDTIVEVREILAGQPEAAPAELTAGARQAVQQALRRYRPRGRRSALTVLPDRPATQRLHAPSRSWGWWITGIAAALLVGIGLFFSGQWDRLRSGLAAAPVVAEIGHCYGNVQLVANGTTQPATAGSPLRVGDRLRTSGAGANATILYVDGTRVALGPNSDAALRVHSEDRGKRLDLAHGTLGAMVATQSAARPMRFATPHAHVIVRGTEFEMAARNDQTRVGMKDGTVEVICLNNSRSVTLTAGYQAVVGKQIAVIAPPDVGRTQSLLAARSTAGLQALYLFDEGKGRVIHDRAPARPPLDLAFQDIGAVSWMPGGGLSVRRPALIASKKRATKILRACQASNELTLEVWVRPHFVSQTGPARIVTVSENLGERNFMLGIGNANKTSPQGAYAARIRSTTTPDGNGLTFRASLGSVTTRLQHIVVTRARHGEARIFVDGRMAEQTTVSGTFANWNATYHLLLAREGTKNWWPFLGDYHLVAVYSRALSEREILRHHQIGVPGRPQTARR